MPLANWFRRLRRHHVFALMLGVSIAGAGAALRLDGLTAVLL